MEYYEKHLSNFRSVLSSREIDAILLANYEVAVPPNYNFNIYYASGLLGFFSPCFLVLTEDDCGLWVNTGDEERARRQTWLNRVAEIERPGGPFHFSPEENARAALQQVRELVGRDAVRVGVDGAHMSGSLLLALVQEGAQVEDVHLDLEKSRMVLDDRELALMRRGASAADRGVEKVMEAVREGITERELSVLAEAEMLRAGAECFWWPNIIASGPEAEFWADLPTDRRIQRGDVLWMDFTPVVRGYTGDIARAFVYGEASPEQMALFTLGEEALAATAAALGSGVTIRKVMEDAAEVVKGSPYEPCYLGPGHMIGLYNSVNPIFLASTAGMAHLPEDVLDAQLEPGMVVAAEIILTVPGLGGVRLEDNYIITTDQPERITHAPITPTVG